MHDQWLPNEHIIYDTKKTPMIFFWPVVFIPVSLFLYYYFTQNTLLHALIWVPFFMLFVMGNYAIIAYATSRYLITNKRVIMREGLFNRRYQALRLETVSQVTIQQDLFGQWFHYGTIALNAFGVTDQFDLVNHPIVFQQRLNQALDKITATHHE